MAARVKLFNLQGRIPYANDPVAQNPVAVIWTFHLLRVGSGSARWYLDGWSGVRKAEEPAATFDEEMGTIEVDPLPVDVSL